MGGDLSDEQHQIIESAAQVLYGLIHARFILTARGMSAMLEKYSTYTYGICPNAECEAIKQAVLPIGSDRCRQASAKVFCPRCNEIYHPRSPRLDQIDGAYFGSSFPHMFMMLYHHVRPT